MQTWDNSKAHDGSAWCFWTFSISGKQIPRNYLNSSYLESENSRVEAGFGTLDSEFQTESSALGFGVGRLVTILFSFELLLFPGVLDFNIPLTKFGRLCINYSISIFSFFLTNRSIVGYSCILSSCMIAMYPGYATVTNDHKSVLEEFH